jgi:tetratricopeptide (TPR) repeat protein
MRELGHKPGISATLTNLGVVARHRGELDRAQAYYEESLELDRRSGEPRGTAITLLDLGSVARLAGDLDKADRSLAESMRLFHELGMLIGIVSCLDALACVEAGRQPERAARLWGAWERMTAELGVESTERDAAERAEAIAVARAGIDPDAFERAWQEGRSLEVDEAVEYALGAGQTPASDRTAAAISPGPGSVATSSSF